MALILIAIIGAVVYIFISIKNEVYDDREAHLTIENQTGQNIIKGSVDLGSRNCMIPLVKNGSSYICAFTKLTDSSYSASLNLEDGSVLESDKMGYVTGGIS